MSQQRLDELVATLARARPVLDDVTRARVAAVVQAAPAAGPRALRAWYRKRRVYAATAAAAAVLAVGLFVRDTTARHAVAELTPSVVVGELPDGAMLSAEPGTSVRGQVAGAAVTVYGPGWAIRHGRQIVVETDALVVERSGGDTPLEIKVRTATIRVQHATFSVDGASVLRVTVIRGEILLSCEGTAASEPVAAGGTAACGPTRAPRTAGSLTAASPPAPGAALADAASPVPPAPPALGEPAAAPPRPVAADEARAPELVVERGGGGGSPGVHGLHQARQEVGGLASSAPPPGIAGTGTGPAGAPQAAASPPELAPAAGPSRAAAPPLSPDASRGGPPRSIAAAPAVHPPAAPLPATLSETAARYAEAEQLLRSDAAAARVELSAFVVAAPAAPEAASALLDLARLAAAADDPIAAGAALDQLAAHPRAASYAMPAAYLRCSLEHADPQWRACLASFRAAFPGSSRDPEVLARLAIATARSGDCPTALPLLVEFRHRYPNGPSDAEVRSWTARCDHATTLPQ